MARSVAALLIFLLAVPAAHAVDYIVGDSSGWSTGVNYNKWASGKTFAVGDNLIFAYTSMHSLSEVTKSDYESCTATTSIQSYADGNTTIPLTASGPRYFLCPAFSHCGNGMKLAVTVSPNADTGATAGGAAPSGSPANAPLLPTAPTTSRADPTTDPAVVDTPTATTTTTTTTTSPEIKRPSSTIPPDVGGAARVVQGQQAGGLVLLVGLGLVLVG